MQNPLQIPRIMRRRVRDIFRKVQFYTFGFQQVGIYIYIYISHIYPYYLLNFINLFLFPYFHMLRIGLKWCQVDLRQAFRAWDKKNLGGLDVAEFQAMHLKWFVCV